MTPQSAPDLTLEGLVHDLNNVLETISEATDILRSDVQWASVCATLQRSVERGRRILDSFCENSLPSLDFEVTLGHSVEFARDFLRAVHGPHIEFVNSVEPGIRLKGGPAAWERVLVNLFLNAAQAMKDGGIVEVTARRAPEGIEITVGDSGPGIAPEILPQIFEPHFTTRPSSRPARSGLGLHIVESIVRQNGGTVSAANRPDRRGAIFRIVLPPA